MSLVSVDRFPDWLIPPIGGFVAEDLDRLPDLPAHTELIDGSLVFASPQSLFRMRLLHLVETALLACVPTHLAVPFAIDIDLTAISR